MNLVLVSGKAGVGKDTFSTFLLRALLNHELTLKDSEREGHRIYRLADPLKEIATQLGWDGNKDEKGRSFLNEIGKAGVVYDKFLWCKKLVSRLENSFNPGLERSTVIISDFRLKHELDYFCNQTNLFRMIYVLRIMRNVKDLESLNKYTSETELDNFTYINKKIDNNSTLTDLESEAMSLSEIIIEGVKNPAPYVQIHFWRQLFIGKKI